MDLHNQDIHCCAISFNKLNESNLLDLSMLEENVLRGCSYSQIVPATYHPYFFVVSFKSCEISVKSRAKNIKQITHHIDD